MKIRRVTATAVQQVVHFVCILQLYTAYIFSAVARHSWEQLSHRSDACWIRIQQVVAIVMMAAVVVLVIVVVMLL